MLIKRPDDVRSSEITPEHLYRTRRRFLQSTLLAAGGLALGPSRFLAQLQDRPYKRPQPGPYDTSEDLTDYTSITTYNNFYEFGTSKGDPHERAGSLKTKPWSVRVEGEVRKPGTVALEDLLKGQTLEDRIYRLRCVEGWSMVIPWLGFPLANLIKRFEPTTRAKFVEFVTLFDPSQMPGQRSNVLQWPYVEGLRIDEAMHPLAILAVGLYGSTLPNQNGAPLRVVVPWKYGFKSAKSIVSIRFVEKEPATAWTLAAPDEYGFYSNVNPDVDHPRWSQKTERRIGEFFKRKTLYLNGYADQVGHLYAGMDLRKQF
jgi:methionine sulfoxide reductase catalytic subunit